MLQVTEHSVPSVLQNTDLGPAGQTAAGSPVVVLVWTLYFSLISKKKKQKQREINIFTPYHSLMMDKVPFIPVLPTICSLHLYASVEITWMFILRGSKRGCLNAEVSVKDLLRWWFTEGRVMKNHWIIMPNNSSELKDKIGHYCSHTQYEWRVSHSRVVL